MGALSQPELITCSSLVAVSLEAVSVDQHQCQLPFHFMLFVIEFSRLITPFIPGRELTAELFLSQMT